MPDPRFRWRSGRLMHTPMVDPHPIVRIAPSAGVKPADPCIRHASSPGAATAAWRAVESDDG